MRRQMHAESRNSISCFCDLRGEVLGNFFVVTVDAQRFQRGKLTRKKVVVLFRMGFAIVNCSDVE